jgi:hypothetical protein
MQSNKKQCKAIKSIGKQCKAMKSIGKQCKAMMETMESNAKQ